MDYTLSDGSKLKIREADINDAKKLLTTAKINIEEQEFIMTSINEFKITVDQEKEWIKSYKDNPTSLLLLAELDNQIVGNLDFKCKPQLKQSHVGEFGIGVLKEYRNKGIGGFLIKELIDWAKKKDNIKKLTLQVFANNDRAIYLYKKHGFQEEGRLISSIKLDNGEYIDNLLMYKMI
jgi:RimJ/RimL family protein N-acetyltransferase